MQFSREQIQAVFDAVGCEKQEVVEAFIEVAPTMSLDNERRLAMVVAQCAHESGNFRFTKEGLSYSVEALQRVWPSRFPDEASAVPYARNSEALANKVYSNRMGNGDEQSGDGYKYRGAGFLQLTGKDNFAAASKYLGFDLVTHPELAQHYALSFRVADWFFATMRRKGLSVYEHADKGDLKSCTKIINGGYIGLEHREKMYRAACEALDIDQQAKEDTYVPTGLFKRGMRGEDVMLIQQKLNEQGYDTNGIDGVFGSGMQNAVRRFQADNNLAADGLAGKGTLAVLFK